MDFEEKNDTESVDSDVVPMAADQWTGDDYQYDREELIMMKTP